MSQQNIATRSLLYDVAATLLALFSLLFGLSWVLQQDGAQRYEQATWTEVCRELLRALSGDGSWASGPPQASVYALMYSTLFLALKGFVMGLLMAVVCGVAIGLRPPLARRVITALNSLRAIPLTLLTVVLAVLPAWTRWPLVAPGLNVDPPDKDPAVLIALGCFLYISVGIAEGISQRNVEREQFFRHVLCLRSRKYLSIVLAREALPHLITACRVALLFSLVLAIVFEQLLNYPGAGRQVWNWMNDAGTATKVGPFPEAQALALVIIIALTGMLLDFAFVAARKHVLRWQRGLSAAIKA